MEAIATRKQPRFFIGESLESSNENIKLYYKLKIFEEHGKFNRAITTVADAAIGLRWLPFSLINPPETAKILNLVMVV